MIREQLNHHSAAVLPFHFGENGLTFVLEQKDPKFKPPYFDNAFCFLGGNWQKGEHTDSSPIQTLSREVREEFWQQYEAPESLNALLGEEFLQREPDVIARYSSQEVNRIKEMSNLLLTGARHVVDYVFTINPPIMKTPLVAGSSIFLKELTREELQTIEGLVLEFQGRLTTDNLRRGSQTAVTSLDKINARASKFAYQYDHILKDLLGNELASYAPVGILRTIDPKLISVRRVSYPQDIGFNSSEGPSYHDLEQMFEFKQK
jgi:hypothetical protein